MGFALDLGSQASKMFDQPSVIIRSFASKSLSLQCSSESPG